MSAMMAVSFPLCLIFKPKQRAYLLPMPLDYYNISSEWLSKGGDLFSQFVTV